MRDASVKRGGGCVKCCLGSSPSNPSRSPSSSTGMALSASSSGAASPSSRLSVYTAVKPLNFMVWPWARKSAVAAAGTVGVTSMSADTVS